jgi:hypothetical protein
MYRKSYVQILVLLFALSCNQAIAYSEVDIVKAVTYRNQYELVTLLKRDPLLINKQYGFERNTILMVALTALVKTLESERSIGWGTKNMLAGTGEIGLGAVATVSFGALVGLSGLKMYAMRNNLLPENIFGQAKVDNDEANNGNGASGSSNSANNSRDKLNVSYGQPVVNDSVVGSSSASQGGWGFGETAVNYFVNNAKVATFLSNADTTLKQIQASLVGFEQDKQYFIKAFNNTHENANTLMAKTEEMVQETRTTLNETKNTTNTMLCIIGLTGGLIGLYHGLNWGLVGAHKLVASPLITLKRWFAIRSYKKIIKTILEQPYLDLSLKNAQGAYGQTARDILQGAMVHNIKNSTSYAILSEVEEWIRIREMVNNAILASHKEVIDE